MDNKLSELKDALEFLETTEFDGEWDSALVGGENGKNYHAVINANDVVVRADDDSRHTSWLCDYLEAVSPVNIRALLAELEAKDKTLELEREKSRRVMSENHQQAKRIAELEAKTAMTMGVGSGNGNLFVHGDYDSIKAAQAIVLENESLRAKLATPVRLLGQMLVHDWDRRVERQAAFEDRKIAWDARLAEDKKAILAAGFTFTVEGDEQS
ncbi:TPA: hypothetical protein U7N74_002134 [Serratia marcescens]|nr:hypothetical protein [Serratia marcescens]HEN7411129.1 hypothetical protein [Serratia marcescens]